MYCYTLFQRIITSSLHHYLVIIMSLLHNFTTGKSCNNDFTITYDNVQVPIITHYYFIIQREPLLPIITHFSLANLQMRVRSQFKFDSFFGLHIVTYCSKFSNWTTQIVIPYPDTNKIALVTFKFADPSYQNEAPWCPVYA